MKVDLEGNVTEELAREARSGFNISAATEKRITRKVVTSLEKSVKDLWENTPPSTLIEDPSLLSAARKRSQLVKFAKMNALVTVVGTLRELVSFAENLVAHGFAIDKDLISDAQEAKQAGKRIVGCHYVVSQFDTKKPSTPAAAKAFADQTFAVLKKKGWGKSWQLPKGDVGLTQCHG